MWTRKQLKENAKAVLTKYYWTAFAISLVISLFVGTRGASGSSTLVQVANAFAQEMNENNMTADELIDAINDHPEIISLLIATILIVCLIDLFIWVVATALNISFSIRSRSAKTHTISDREKTAANSATWVSPSRRASIRERSRRYS